MIRILKYGFLLIFVIALASCTEVFNISPYDTLPENGPQDLTNRNISRWQERSGGTNGPMTIAFVSDPHFYYSDLADVVSHINSDPTVDLVIVPGDLTDQALVREFEWFHDRMVDLTMPWIAVIGNHDHQSNGRLIYEQMFGQRNFLVDINGYRFIFFDNTVWESEIPPDMPWLSSALAGAGELVPIVIMHIPPQNDQLADGQGAQMRELFAVHEVPHVIHGHLHAFAEYTLPGSDTQYLCVPWPRAREYARVTFDAGEVLVERISI